MTITKWHTLSGLTRNLFALSSEGLKYNIQMSAGLVFFESPLLGLQMAFPLCTPTLSLSLCAQISSCYKDTSHAGLRPIHISFLNLTYLLKAPSPNPGVFWGTGGYEFNIGLLRGCDSVQDTLDQSNYELTPKPSIPKQNHKPYFGFLSFHIL